MIVDYNINTGLLIVGHAALFLQDKAKNWYFTEFTGTKKRNAKVSCEPINEFLKTTTPNRKKVYCYTLLRSCLTSKLYKIGGCLCYYIKGNFDQSINIALKIKENYPKYNLVFNNCLSYAKYILGLGEFNNFMTGFYVRNSSSIVPTIFINNLVIASSLYNTNYNRKMILRGII